MGSGIGGCGSPDAYLRTADPSSFNDPFEVRPGVDQTRYDFFCQTHEDFYRALGSEHSLLKGESMVGRPVEDAVDFAETLNERFREELSNQFRVVCFSKTWTNSLMWGHYAHCHRGLVLGLDTERFFSGLSRSGFPVEYSTSRVQLPSAYYRGQSVENYRLDGSIANDPNELVVGPSGIEIRFDQYHRMVQKARLDILQTKSQHWAYEEEVRLIYEIPIHRPYLREQDGHWFVPIPPEAVKEIIIGARSEPNLINAIVEAYKNGKLGKPILAFTYFHPATYNMLRHETDIDYIAKYCPIRKL